MTDTRIASESQARSTLHASRSAERVLSLLDFVVTEGMVGLTEAATATGIPVSTALRHMRVLANLGFVIRDEAGRYSAGPSFVRIALGAFRSGPYARLTTAAQPMLKHLVAVTEESAYLAVKDRGEAVYIATVESRRAIRHVGWVGKSAPIRGTAVGEALMSKPKPPGERPDAVFKIGAIEPDVTAVVAPIHGPSGVLGALSVLGPAERIVGERLERTTRAVVDAAVVTSLTLSVADVRS